MLWTQSPFTVKPPPPEGEEVVEENPFEDWALGGVSSVGERRLITLFHRKEAGQQLIVDSGDPTSEFKVLEVTQDPDDYKKTIVKISKGGQTGSVTYDDKLLAGRQAANAKAQAQAAAQAKIAAAKAAATGAGKPPPAIRPPVPGRRRRGLTGLADLLGPPAADARDSPAPKVVNCETVNRAQATAKTHHFRPDFPMHARFTVPLLIALMAAVATAQNDAPPATPPAIPCRRRAARDSRRRTSPGTRSSRPLPVTSPRLGSPPWRRQRLVLRLPFPRCPGFPPVFPTLRSSASGSNNRRPTAT